MQKWPQLLHTCIGQFFVSNKISEISRVGDATLVQVLPSKSEDPGSISSTTKLKANEQKEKKKGKIPEAT